MYNRNSIFDYYSVDSVVHRLNPVYKTLSVLFMVFFLILGHSVVDMILINLFIMVMVLFSDISMMVYFNHLSVSKAIIFFAFVISFVVSGSFWIGILWGIKVIDLIIYLSLITMTSSFNSIVYGVKWLFRPMNGIIDVNKIGVSIGLFSKFITILYNENVRIRNSKELRGVLYRDMKFVDRISSFFKNIMPVYKNSLNRIRMIRMSMSVRNYDCFLNRSNYRLNKFGKTDTIMLGINVVVLILVMIY